MWRGEFTVVGKGETPSNLTDCANDGDSFQLLLRSTLNRRRDLSGTAS